MEVLLVTMTTYAIRFMDLVCGFLLGLGRGVGNPLFNKQNRV